MPSQSADRGDSPFATPLSRKRPLGLAKGLITIPKEFFDDLPADVLDSLSEKTR